MKKVVNWNKIGLFAAALFFSEFAVGFVTGGLEAAELRLAASFVLSLCFSALLFGFMAVGQRRPFLHASLALLLTIVISLSLGAALPAWWGETPPILALLEWLVLVGGLIIGTSVGRYVGLRRARTNA